MAIQNKLVIANYSGHVSSILHSGDLPEFAQPTRETRRNIKFKMAKRSILEVDYAQFNNFLSVVLYNNPPRRQRKT